LKRIGVTDATVFNTSAHVDAVVAAIASTLKSTTESQREAGIIACAALLRNNELAPQLFQLLTPLLEPTAWFSLSKEEIGVLRTPVGKLYKLSTFINYYNKVFLSQCRNNNAFLLFFKIIFKNSKNFPPSLA